MTNSKDIPSDFEGLDLDQSLEKIIKETPLEDLERDEIINILKVKLNDKNSSTKDDQLTFSETLSFIKETKKLLR